MIECSMGPRQMSGLSPGLRKPTEMTLSPCETMGAIVFARHLRLLVGAEHERDVRAINVAVEQSNFVAHLTQGDCQIDRERGLADSALAGTDGNDGVDAR